MSHEHGGGEEAIRRSNLEAQQYNDTKRSRKLRQTPELIVPLYHGAHQRIHAHLEQVPIPDTFTLDRVLRDYRPIQDNPVYSIYALQKSIHEAVNFNARASKVAREVGMIACEALEMQVATIKEGLATL